MLADCHAIESLWSDREPAPVGEGPLGDGRSENSASQITNRMRQQPMLEGIRILDLTWVLGGPFGTQSLAQLGAEIIKLEPPAGDLARRIPPHFHEGESSFFLSANRGKRSVVVDIKQAQGHAVLLDLVRRVDAVVYGFSPEVPKRLGLDQGSLAKVNPAICVGEIIGIHDGPPYSRTPAFDLVVQALGGIMSITGEPGGRPLRIGYQIADLAGGLYLALGTLAAIHRAKATGRGGKVQISLLDCQIALLTWQAQNYFISGEVPKALGSRHAMIAPSDTFRGADGKDFVISPTGDAFWKQFCEAIGKPELSDDPRFVTGADRIANVETLTETLEAIFAAAPADHWVEQLTGSRVPAAKVNSVAEAVEHPAADLRNMVERVPHRSSRAPLDFLGNPFKFDGAEPLAYPPPLGADTFDVLGELCGYGPERLSQLQQSGIIVQGEMHDASNGDQASRG